MTPCYVDCFVTRFLYLTLTLYVNIYLYVEICLIILVVRSYPLLDLLTISPLLDIQLLQLFCWDNILQWTLKSKYKSLWFTTVM